MISNLIGISIGGIIPIALFTEWKQIHVFRYIISLIIIVTGVMLVSSSMNINLVKQQSEVIEDTLEKFL